MKRHFFLPLLVFTLVWAASPFTVMAQTDSPPDDAAAGVVLGKIINRNEGKLVTESLDVMLHIWDKEYVDLGMEHGQSEADGTFRFSDVALDPQRLYAVMATFEDVTYFSDVVPGPADSNEIELAVPVTETTRDLAAVQIDQMHLLFDFVQDGMETTEIYVLSNLGERTVKEAVPLDSGQAATIRFPLPSDADFIFFQPNGQDRFIKFPGGFADTYPLLPGESSEQFMVQYLVPFSSGRTYAYTAPVNVGTINFLLPTDAGVSLEGQGLSDPQPYTLQSGESYQLYSYGNIGEGESIKIAFQGKPLTTSTTGTDNPTLPLVLGSVILGLTMVGVGFWWWRKPEERILMEHETVNLDREYSTFDDIITDIARLDEAHEQGMMEPDEHKQRRQELMLLAKENFPEEFK